MERKQVQLDVLRANLARYIAMDPGPEPKDRVWIEIIYQLCDEIEHSREDTAYMRSTIILLKAERDSLRVQVTRLEHEV